MGRTLGFPALLLALAACDGQDGTREVILVEQFPAAGLSKVEVFPEDPAHVTLQPNPALVDRARAASAGLDLGYSATARGDVRNRDLGVVLPDGTTPVDTVYVYVDRSLPASLAATLAWTAWRSDDNVSWTPVAFEAPVAFDLASDRFRMSIARTEARYLKVVTRPLATGITTDPQYAEVFATEIELFVATGASRATARADPGT